MSNTPGSTLVGSPIEISNQQTTPIARAEQISVDTSAFNHNLSSADNTVQKALETLDDLTTSGGVSDGDKGDIVVSGGGTIWTLDSGAVTLAKTAEDLRSYIRRMATAL
jgi:hypothetical protein